MKQQTPHLLAFLLALALAASLAACGGPVSPDGPPADDNAADDDAASVPIATVTPSRLELRGYRGEEVEGSFVFGNAGSRELSYTVEAGAGLDASPAEGTVPPGGEVRVEVSGPCRAAALGGVTIRSDDPDEPVHDLPVTLTCPERPAGGFEIEVVFVGEGFTPAYRQAFRDAAERWSSVITGDLPDHDLAKAANRCGFGEPAYRGTVDDLLVHAVIEPIDGPGGVLGAAGPCYLRPAGRLPINGGMRFDSADVSGMHASGRLEAVILHEMGHVLGIGTVWEGHGLLDYAPDDGACRSTPSFTRAPAFVGAAARDEHEALGGVGAPPVEDEYGPGTRCGHWDEEAFAHELMTGFLGYDEASLSRLTVAGLADLGYDVDPDAADAYALPACSPACLRAHDAGQRLEEVLHYPRPAPAGVVRPSGS